MGQRNTLFICRWQLIENVEKPGNGFTHLMKMDNWQFGGKWTMKKTKANINRIFNSLQNCFFGSLVEWGKT